MTNHFLSCDWGTSSLRLRLADANNGSIKAEVRCAEGIGHVFDSWQQTGLPEDKKAAFYRAVIHRRVKELEQQTGQMLNELPLILSGMASSSIGLMEMPYATCPFSLDGSGMVTALIAASAGFEHDTLLISGAKTRDDVMRGEETQLIGCIEPRREIKNELFIFPGTHSKHIIVHDNSVTGFNTCMTGEVFSLLCKNSILKTVVEPSGFDWNSFKKGLHDGRSPGLLNTIFKVRTNGLFGIYSKTENYNYLSGLLIGAELNNINTMETDAVNLVCGDNLHPYYQIALNELAADKNMIILSVQQANEASVKGQLQIAKQAGIL